MTEDRHLYRVLFYDQGRVCEMYAAEVSQGGLYGFIEIQQLIFGAKTEVVIDPSEERLRREFEGVKRVHVPMHSVIRVDEVEKEGTGRILNQEGDSANVTPFPLPMYSPKNSTDS